MIPAQLSDLRQEFTRANRGIIVDDLLATGGTAASTAKLVELLGGYVKAIAFVVELPALGGRDRLQEHEVVTLVSYDEA